MKNINSSGNDEVVAVLCSHENGIPMLCNGTGAQSSMNRSTPRQMKEIAAHRGRLTNLCDARNDDAEQNYTSQRIKLLIDFFEPDNIFSWHRLLRRTLVHFVHC